jgi:hypothetical protein
MKKLSYVAMVLAAAVIGFMPIKPAEANSSRHGHRHHVVYRPVRHKVYYRWVYYPKYNRYHYVKYYY